MSIEEGRFYNPSDGSAKSAFQVMDARHFLLGDTYEALKKKSPEKLRIVAHDYFMAGLAFLANCSQDPYLEMLGEAAWHPMQRKSLTTVISELQIPEFENGVPDSGPYPIVQAYFIQEGNRVSSKGYVVLPPQYIFAARENPMQALAETAGIASGIRDYDNARFVIDPEQVKIRCDASSAQFLKVVLGKHPTAIASISEGMRNILRMYPQGVDSLQPSQLYKGINPRAQNRG